MHRPRTVINVGYPMAIPIAPKQRPMLVTIAAFSLFVVAALLAVGAIISAATLGKAVDTARAAYPEFDDADLAATAVKLGVGLTIAIHVVLFILLVLLGLFVLRGSNGMRITTWVIAGLGAVCLGCTAIGTTGSAFDNTNGTRDGVTINVNDAVPGWVRGANIAITVISMVVLIAAIIMLALPRSNDFFRRPMLPMMGYPGGYGGYGPPMPYGYQPIPPGAYPGQAPAGYAAQPPYGAVPPYPTPGYPGTPGYPTVPSDPGTSAYPGAPGYPTPPGYSEPPGYPQSPVSDGTNEPPPPGPFAPPS